MIDKKPISIDTAKVISNSVKKRLGEILIEQNLITQEDLDNVLEIQHNEGHRLGEILVNQGIVKIEDLLAILSAQYNVPIVDLKKRKIQPQVIALIPEDIARKATVIPLEVTNGLLVVAMAFPDDVQTLRDISTRTGKRIQIALAAPGEINNAIDQHYRAGGEIEQNLGHLIKPTDNREETVVQLTAETPVAQSLDLILQQAVRDRASDVHLEPQENRLRIRFRIDGMLHDMFSLPMNVHGAIISRIKILAEMNIAEQRRSQDGQFSAQLGNREIDFRAATMATAYGERVALRILDRTLTPLSLEEIGLLPEQLAKYCRVLASPFGVILVGGPTGSGKTTTLYASLNQFNRDTQNIITIEDPIEYRFNNINQTQINPKAGITFASGLRTILRHDPDIVLVGEVRDKDTATIVTQAALTGRLVLATIHANDAISVLFRLIDLGIEPYLIAPTLVAAVSQRMARRICPYCKVPTELDSVEEAAYEKELGEKPGAMFRGAGCNMCAHTGYRGRVALFEMLKMSETLRQMVLTGKSSDEIKAAALKEGMQTIQRDGMLKVKAGITTVSEVIRIAFSGNY
ncbi:MAG: GspE/PulE family protein [Dehalococcoidales bacterium]|nr:GspE/PulE family protein [Dehalococcoidales bacterium]